MWGPISESGLTKSLLSIPPPTSGRNLLCPIGFSHLPSIRPSEIGKENQALQSEDQRFLNEKIVHSCVFTSLAQLLPALHVIILAVCAGEFVLQSELNSHEYCLPCKS